jgi:hypothetical protein
MITTSPRHILQILTTSHSSFPKGTKFHERAKDFMGPKGVFVSDTEDWVFVSPYTGEKRVGDIFRADRLFYCVRRMLNSKQP